METLANGSAVPASAETTFVEPPDTDVEGGQTNGDDSASSAPEAGTPAKVKDPVQERFDKLTRDKYDALREGDRKGYLLEQRDRELADLRAQLEARETKQVAPATGFPTQEQYGFDEASYQAAVVAHITKIAETQGKTAAEDAFRKERERQQSELTNKSWATKEAAFIKSKPDYMEKVIEGGRRGAWDCTKEMTDVITRSEFGPAIAYYLAENAEKAASIARLSPLDQARELGRIEAKLEAAKAPPKPLVSQAPPPVAKVDASDAEVEKDPSTMTDAQFARWRKKQIAQRR